MAAPMVVGIRGIRQGVSELLQAVQYKAVWYLLRFCRSFEVKFWFPQFGGIRGPYGGGPSWCQMGRLCLFTDRVAKPLGVKVHQPPKGA